MDCCSQYKSPIGTLRLEGRDGILTGISFDECSCECLPEDFAPVKQWLDDYFCGISREIDFPMELTGSAFQKLVWNLLQKIPYGETRTYGDLAREAAQLLGRERMSAQAVGQAVGRNPIAVIIPCHRCIGAGGRLAGFAWGPERKQWLLTHEHKQMEDEV